MEGFYQSAETDKGLEIKRTPSNRRHRDKLNTNTVAALMIANEGIRSCSSIELKKKWK